MARVRRTKIEVIQEKISDMERKIRATENKLAAYKSELANLQTQLKKAVSENDKVKEKERLNEIMNLIKKSPMSLEEIREMFAENQT